MLTTQLLLDQLCFHLLLLLLKAHQDLQLSFVPMEWPMLVLVLLMAAIEMKNKQKKLMNFMRNVENMQKAKV